jgi:Fe-S cluster assembly iron-binding protein IscA
LADLAPSEISPRCPDHARGGIALAHEFVQALLDAAPHSATTPDQNSDNDGDAIVAFDGVEVVVDKKSAPYLEGASIDYEDTLHSSGFQINNPNAASTCACGDSFN